MLRLLSVDQIQQRVDDAEYCLQLFQCNKNEFLGKYVRMNETGNQNFTAESNRQLAEWKSAGESRLKRLKTQTSAGMVLGSVHWDAHGILFIDYLGKRRSINNEYYIISFVRSKDEIPPPPKKKRLQMKKKKGLFFLEDYAPCHNSIAKMAKLHGLQFELLQYPPYSSYLAPSDYGVFADLKRMLLGMRFGLNEEERSKTDAYFEAKDKSFYKNDIEVLEYHSNQCITLEGDYVDNKVDFA